jgi:hypothetical protein
MDMTNSEQDKQTNKQWTWQMLNRTNKQTNNGHDKFWAGQTNKQWT